jgi:hypothetical protein
MKQAEDSQNIAKNAENYCTKILTAIKAVFSFFLSTAIFKKYYC